MRSANVYPLGCQNWLSNSLTTIDPCPGRITGITRKGSVPPRYPQRGTLFGPQEDRAGFGQVCDQRIKLVHLAAGALRLCQRSPLLFYSDRTEAFAASDILTAMLVNVIVHVDAEQFGCT